MSAVFPRAIWRGAGQFGALGHEGSAADTVAKPLLLDLFSGIGGFSLGLNRSGFETVAMCEIDPWCQRLLAKHWPHARIYNDVRDLNAARLRADGIKRVDAICGGFPCQDISVAGRGAGLVGERSGLWREYARLVGELRPRFVIVENVGALRGRGLAAVLGDFAAFGYDAQWHVVPAAAVGAPHLRERVWIVAERAVADADNVGRRGLGAATWHGNEPACGVAADADGQRVRLESGRRHGPGRSDAVLPGGDGPAGNDPDSHSQRCERGRQPQHGDEQGSPWPEPERLGARGRRHRPPSAHATGPGSSQLRRLQRRLAGALAAAQAPWQRTSEPPLRGVDDGLPAGLDGPGLARHAKLIRKQDRERTKALGNAVVPLIPEIIGRCLLEAA